MLRSRLDHRESEEISQKSMALGLANTSQEATNMQPMPPSEWTAICLHARALVCPQGIPSKARQPESLGRCGGLYLCGKKLPHGLFRIRLFRRLVDGRQTNRRNCPPQDFEPRFFLHFELPQSLFVQGWRDIEDRTLCALGNARADLHIRCSYIQLSCGVASQVRILLFTRWTMIYKGTTVCECGSWRSEEFDP